MSDLNDLLKTLQKEYLEELPQKIEGLRVHMSDKNIPALIEDFHKLKGTGKTYGLPEVSEVGEKMEKLFTSCPAVGFSELSAAIQTLSDIYSRWTSDDIAA